MPIKTDRELVVAYVEAGDESSFSELVVRHTQMVYRTCFRMLGNIHDTQDATQAVFIVLARKAVTLRREGNLGGWLNKVARNVALQALERRATSAKREKEVAMWQETVSDEAGLACQADAVLQLVDQELAGLSAVLRQAVVLRYLQGNSEKQAAELAACPQGTLSRRASDGLAKLRARLAKRGVALSGVALAGLLTSEASAAVPETLLPSILATVKTAVATTATATGATSTAAMLAKGAMKAMYIAKVKMVAAIAAAVIVTGTAVPVGIAVAQAASKEAKPAESGDNRRTAAAGDYLVIDLSGGPSASNYPVGYLSAVPSGGWSDEYKTTKLVMRKIPAGTFTMGSPTNELGRSDNETQHTVTLTKAFYLGVFEVTQLQWELVMGNKPSCYTNATCYQTRPVEQVSYYDIRESANNRAMSPNWPATNTVHANSFMGKLREKTGVTGFDLPTESQWEYACRAGTATALNSGYNLTNAANDAQMNVVGRYYYNSGASGSSASRGGCETNNGTAAVGSYQANAWGLYDMHGNVCEWCLDWHGPYPGTETDPQGVASGPYRVVRGGGWGNGVAWNCRSANRRGGFLDSDGRDSNFGFRVAMTPP